MSLDDAETPTLGRGILNSNDRFAFWGGIDLIVPEGWTVESRVVPLLGAFEDKTAGGRSAGVEPTGRLVVRGFVVMGGAEVKNQPTECECTPSSPRRAD